MAVDLVVIGGGPVGLATALGAAHSGLGVCVAEARPTPIDKACGEGLMPSAVASLEALGVDVEGHPFEGITYVDEQGRTAAAAFPSEAGRGVRRLHLHEVLSKAVRDAGIEVVSSTARLGAVRPTHVEVQLDDTVRLARYVAAADGLHSRVRRSLGLGLPPRGQPRYGLRQHWRVAPWSTHVEVHWSSEAELYVTPVSEREVGVAVLTSTRGKTYSDWVRSFPQVEQRLRGASAGSAVLGAGPLEQRTRRRTAGRVLLVGDAAGYVDAITGEGLAVGFRQAAELAKAVCADEPEAYEIAWRSVTRPSRLITLGLLQVTQMRPVRSRLVPAAQAFPTVFNSAVAALA